MVHEYGINNSEAEEIFRYIGGPSGQFQFAEFISEKNPNLAHYFGGGSNHGAGISHQNSMTNIQRPHDNSTPSIDSI